MVHQRIDHQFAFEEFAYDTPENFQPCIKLSFFFNKLPDVSYEHFYKHYGHVHADLTVGTKAFGQFNIQRYTQHHATPEMREKLRSIGMSVLDWDACSTLWVKSWEDAERFFGSPEYSKLADDCKHFMDTSNGIPCMAGHELIAFGRGVPGVDAKDGIRSYRK